MVWASLQPWATIRNTRGVRLGIFLFSAFAPLYLLVCYISIRCFNFLNPLFILGLLEDGMISAAAESLLNMSCKSQIRSCRRVFLHWDISTSTSTMYVSCNSYMSSCVVPAGVRDACCRVLFLFALTDTLSGQSMIINEIYLLDVLCSFSYLTNRSLFKHLVLGNSARERRATHCRSKGIPRWHKSRS